MIRELISGLPEQVRDQIEQYRADYTRWLKYAEFEDEGYVRIGRRYADEVREHMHAYTLALMHTGLVTERGRQAIFVYMTVPVREAEEV